MSGPLARIARITDATSRRVSSYDRSGGNEDWVEIPAGGTLTLAEMPGSGCVTHIWITLLSDDPLARRNLVFRAYWDGQEHPSVEAPIGDFFGQGWGLKYNFVSLPLAAAPRDGNALVCYFPMPYGDGARITVENQGEHDCPRFYYYVDYEERPVAADEGRFHARYNQELTAPEATDAPLENAWIKDQPDPKNPSDATNYLFCDPEGQGHYVGVNLYVHAPSAPWPGEGDDMFLIDGEPWPGLHGTGTEDYFNTSWGPDEHYLHPYFGIAYAPSRNNPDPRFGWIGRMHYYRFHLEDPIRFQRSLRASIEHGHANGMTLELASVAYWYQTMPSRPFPPLPSAAARRPKPPTTVEDIHRWRHEWRMNRGGGPLWGNEP